MRAWGAIAVALSVGCAQPEPGPASGTVRYAVRCDPRGVLEVRLVLGAGAPKTWEWAHGHERIEGLACDPEGAFQATASGVQLGAGARELRYRYRLVDGEDLATGAGGNGTFAVSGAAYLLRPREDVSAVLEVAGPVALPQSSSDGPVRLSAAELRRPGFHAFGVEALAVDERLPGVRLALLRGSEAWDEEALRAWVARSVRELSTVFPRPSPPLVIVIPRAGEGVGVASLELSDPPSVAIPVGQATRDFDDAWVLLRALCRAALPEGQPEATWIREGAATYLQHLASARGGRSSVGAALARLRRGVQRVAPQVGRDSLRLLGRSRGERAYAVAYWGGALFMLDLDLRLRARGHRLEEVWRGLEGRGRVGPEAFAAEVDAVGGAGLFAELEAAHLEGPALRAAEEVFARVGVAADGALSAAGAAQRAALAEPVTPAE